MDANLTDFSVTGYSIKVPVTIEQFDHIERFDHTDIDVVKLLEEKGAYNVDYNGHFGANIYFDVPTLDKAKEVIEVLNEVLKMEVPPDA